MTHPSEDPKVLYEWRLEGQRWIKVATGYDDDYFVNHQDVPSAPDDDPGLSLEEEVALLKAKVAGLESQLAQSFLLID